MEELLKAYAKKRQEEAGSPLELHPATHGDFDVVLRDGTRLTLSRTWRDRLRGLC